MNMMSTNTKKRKKLMMIGTFMVMATLMLTFFVVFAAPNVPDTLNEMLTNVIFYVGLIFQTVGIFLAVYAIGQMIMAFKDENPDAKTKAATLLVVAIILVTLPQIIQGLDLQKLLTGK